MTSALGLRAEGQAPPLTPSQQELQAPLALEDKNPTQAGAAHGGPSALRSFGSLLVVLGLVGAGFWALKKWGHGRLPGTGGGKLRIEETLALGQRRYVSILRVEDERFLVALGSQGVTLLARLDGVEAPGPTTFGEALGGQVELGRPMPVREMEALIQGGKP